MPSAPGDPRAQELRSEQLRQIALAGAAPGELTADDAQAIVDIAYLTVAVDQHLDRHELVAFRALVDGLRGATSPGATPLTDEAFAALVARLAVQRTRDELLEHLARIAPRLTTPVARALAFKASVALAAADFADSDEEFELELDLVDALELSNEDAERLRAEVTAALASAAP